VQLTVSSLPFITCDSAKENTGDTRASWRIINQFIMTKKVTRETWNVLLCGKLINWSENEGKMSSGHLRVKGLVNLGKYKWWNNGNSTLEPTEQF
jgi:hypothetical protein